MKRRHSIYPQLRRGEGVSPCGHRARFLIEELDGGRDVEDEADECALCLLEDFVDEGKEEREKAETLRAELADERTKVALLKARLAREKRAEEVGDG